MKYHAGKMHIAKRKINLIDEVKLTEESLKVQEI